MVLGGRGLMGRRILRLLKKSLPDAELICAGRTQADVPGTTFARFDLAAPEDHGDALRRADVLINTVGPFNYDPGPIIRACHDNGCHYVDLAETPAFMRGAREIARDLRVAVVTGCSSVPALIEVFARRWQGRGDVASIRAQLSIGTNNEASSTLLYSMLLPVGRQRAEVEGRGRWFDRIWMRGHEGIGARRYASYPCGLEGGGISLGDRDVPIDFGFGFDRRTYTVALWALAPFVALTPRSLLKLGSKVGAAVSPVFRPLGTKIGIMAIDALSETGATLEGTEIIARENGLDVPSWPSVWAAELLLKKGGSGDVSLADLLTPEEAEARLKQAGYEVRHAGA
jgi:hypothetical protein